MITDIPVLLKEVKNYVEALYNRNAKAELLYHNLEHTQNVVKRSYEIAAVYALHDNDLFKLIVAAWFHDTGHLFGTPFEHEERSAIICKDYLEEKVPGKEVINSIADCIMATRLYKAPVTFLEKVIADADTYNLGTEEFFKTDKLLRKEFELRLKHPFPNWKEMTLDLFAKHTYFTSYCQSLLNEGKEKNKKIVESELKDE